MEKEENNYLASSLDHYSLLHMKPQQIGVDETSSDHNGNNHQLVDYMLHNTTQSSQPPMSFADVMQFADFGPKLALMNQPKNPDEEENNGINLIDPAILNESEEHENLRDSEESKGEREDREGLENTSVQLRFLGEKNVVQENNITTTNTTKNKRKRPRSVKTSEEVESQRMTHIAVERNRRKQMNDHLRVLRSLMPGSYVQRGDQASIIGGAIEFVRELEQLLQCLESQKRRRLYGDSGGGPTAVAGDSSSIPIQQQPPQPFIPGMPLPNDQMNLVDLESGGLREETAESKSCLADIEVKLLGFDAMIKILSRRRPGQLIQTIAALEDLQLNILHTNITTIEQTVLYSFNVKVDGEARFTADDIANSVQQIFSFIHANTTIL